MLCSPGPFNPKELVEKVEKKTPAASPCPVAMVPSHTTSSPVCDGLRRSVCESVFVCVSRPAFDDAGCC